MKIHSKAWSVNKANFKEPYFAPDGVYYAETPGKAKQKVLQDIMYDDFEDWKGDKISFLNLKVVRAKMADKYMIDGVLKTAHQIDYDKRKQEQRDRLNKLVADNPDAMAYIKKRGMYYRPDCCGYTERQTDAGIYPIRKAANEVMSCDLGDGMEMIVIEKDKHNARINKKIEELQSLLLA